MGTIFKSNCCFSLAYIVQLEYRDLARDLAVGLEITGHVVLAARKSACVGIDVMIVVQKQQLQ